MKIVIFRFILFWGLIHIVLFFAEWYRYKHGNWSWSNFRRHGMLDITCIVFAVDIITVAIGFVGGIIHWIFSPVMN